MTGQPLAHHFTIPCRLRDGNQGNKTSAPLQAWAFSTEDLKTTSRGTWKMFVGKFSENPIPIWQGLARSILNHVNPGLINPQQKLFHWEAGRVPLKYQIMNVGGVPPLISKTIEWFSDKATIRINGISWVHALCFPQFWVVTQNLRHANSIHSISYIII